MMGDDELSMSFPLDQNNSNRFMLHIHVALSSPEEKA